MSSTLENQSGRGVPFQPGWVGVIVCMVAARWSAMPATVNGPPPPCRMRAGRPVPVSLTVRLRSERSAMVRLVGVVMRLFLSGLTRRYGFGGGCRRLEPLVCRHARTDARGRTDSPLGYEPHAAALSTAAPA